MKKITFGVSDEISKEGIDDLCRFLMRDKKVYLKARIKRSPSSRHEAVVLHFIAEDDEEYYIAVGIEEET